MHYRLTANGTLFAPERGHPPEVPDGYIRDPKDLFHFLPILIQCDNRFEERRKMGCCDDVSIELHCKVIKGRLVNQGLCFQCQGNASWIQKHVS